MAAADCALPSCCDSAPPSTPLSPLSPLSPLPLPFSAEPTIFTDQPGSGANRVATVSSFVASQMVEDAGQRAKGKVTVYGTYYTILLPLLYTTH